MQLVFDASTVQPSSGGGLCFPLADYLVEIVKTEGQPVKGSTDKGMLVLTLKVVDANSPLANQTHAYRFNLWHDNPDTVRIAYSQLSAVMHVIGRMQIQDSQQLIGGKFIATIGPQDDNAKYSEIKAVKDLYGNAPGGQSQQAPPQTQQPIYQPQPMQQPPPPPPVAVQVAPQQPQGAPYGQQPQPQAPWGAPPQQQPMQQQQQPQAPPPAAAPWTTQSGGAPTPPWGNR